MARSIVSPVPFVVWKNPDWSGRFGRLGLCICWLIICIPKVSASIRSDAPTRNGCEFARDSRSLRKNVAELNHGKDSTYQDTSSMAASPIARSPLILPQFPDSAHYFYNPCPLRTGENIFNLGFSFDILPEAIVEQEVPSPTLDVQFKHGFSPSFSLYSDVSTNYYTNVVEAGIQWNTGNDDFSLAFGSGLNGFAGSYSLGGEFDNTTAAALAYIPIIEIGHKFGNVAMSIHLAADYVFYAETHISSLYDNGLQHRVNDIWATLTFEQPFFGNTRVSTGISVTYSRTPYQIWMLFDSFDEYLIIPEFFFSFQL